MRILYVGSLNKTACATFYLHAMQRLGHEVTAFDPQYFVTSGNMEKLIFRLTKTPGTHRVRSAHEQILTLCRKTEFDLVFVMAENFLHGESIREIQSLHRKATRCIYHSHDNNFSSGILKPKDFFSKTLPQYDLVFTTKSQNVAKYKALGQEQSFFIPSAYEPTVHRKLPTSKKPFPITFIGTYDYSRDAFLDKIGWNDLFVWGNGWTRYKGYKAHQDHITPHAIYLDEFADVTSHTLLSLGLLREEAEDLHTQRTFEIPACGSLQIAPRNKEILSFFEEDKEIVCFGSLDELKDKIHYYLNHPLGREKIAQGGYTRCTTGKHTYSDRVTTMLNQLLV